MRKNVIGAVLAAAMLTQTCAGLSVMAAEPEVTALNASRIAADKLPEEDIVYMGAADATLDEEDRIYSFPVYREGNLDSEASIDVHTFDMTAIYGKDYELVMDDVEEVGEDITLLEKYTKEARDAEEEQPEEEQPEDADTESVNEYFNWMTEDDESEDTVNASETSELAQLKEEQTGEETRDLHKTEINGVMSSVLQQVIPDAIDELDTSAEMTLTFAPGENEKILKFRILDDSISEGTENFSIMLTNGQGVKPYLVTSTAITINDDEPEVKSEISFTKPKYTSKDGKVTLTVKREGAEQSIASMQIMSCEDTAKAGTNYTEINENLAFAPYETEKDIEINVTGKGEFTVSLKDLKACNEGEYTKATIVVDEDSNIELMSSEKSFDVKIDGKEYYVEYTSGSKMGKIMDDSYSTPLHVGNYIFSSNSEHGGIFKYSKDQRTGSKPNAFGTLTCEYKHNSDDNMNENYGKVEYLHTTAWCEGKVWTYATESLPAIWYQYMLPDWTETSSYAWGERSRFELMSSRWTNSFNSDSDETDNDDDSFDSKTRVTVEGKFSRTLDKDSASTKGAIKIGADKEVPSDTKVTPYIYAVDNDGNTPKSYVNFYGIAAMFKKYNVTLEYPEDKKFLDGQGGTPSYPPLQAELKCGAQTINGGESRDIYANDDANVSNLVLTLNTSMVNGHEGKFGSVTGYKIEILPTKDDKTAKYDYPGDFISYLKDNKNKTVGYIDYSDSAVNKEIDKINKNMDTIPYDAYFIDWIEHNRSDISLKGAGYYNTINITPVIEYNDVNVTVVKPYGDIAGHFDDPELKLTSGSSKTVTYHAGDMINLSATSDDANYHIVGYEVSTDGGIKYDAITSTDTLFLESFKSYMIRPLLAENNNRIEIQFEDGAKDIFEINNIIPQSEIPKPKNDEEEDLRGKYILNANPSGSSVNEKMTPVVGKDYSIGIIVKKDPSDTNKVYRPVITDAMTGQKYNAQTYYINARSKMGDNIIRIGCEEVNKSELKTYTIKGTVNSSYAPIRSTGTELKTLPVANYNVSMAVSQKTDENKNVILNSQNSITSGNGEYQFTNITAKAGDVIPVLVSNGLSTGYASSVTVSDCGKDEDGSVLSTSKPILLDYPSDFPKVTSISYKYDKSTNNQNEDLRQNSVNIVDDTLSITAVVDSNGRTVKQLDFTVYTVTGQETTYEVPRNDNNPSVYVCKIPKMTDNLYNGDRVKVRIVDEKTLSPTVGDTGDTIEELAITYPYVDTGLVFYTENVLKVPQTYDTQSTPTVNVPLLGNTTANAQSGLLSFSRTNWDEEVTGYTLSINLGANYSSKAVSTADKMKVLNSFQQLNKNVNDVRNKKMTAEQALIDQMINNLNAEIPNETDEERKARIQKATDDLETEKKAMKQIQQDANNEAKKNMAGFNNSAWDVSAVIILAFNFVYDPNKDEYTLIEGNVLMGGTFDYAHTWYTTIECVPCFLNLSGTLQVDFGINYTTNNLDAGTFENYAGNIAEILNNQGDVDETLTLMLAGKIQVGVGLCGIFSAGGYISLLLQFQIGFSDDQKHLGFLIEAGGGLNFDVVISKININIAHYKQGWGSLETAADFSFFGGLVPVVEGGRNEANQASLMGAEVIDVNENGEYITMSEYSAGTDNLTDFGKNGDISLMAMPTAVSKHILLENAAERTRPHIIPLDNGRKMIVFIANNNNTQMLYYSVFDGNEWSEPVCVADDGTFDSTPTVLKYNDKVIIAWADANAPFASDESTVEKLNKFGIACAVYDIKTDTIGEKKVFADDNFFNLSPHLTAVGDTIYCSYMKRDISGIEKETELLDITNTYSTMAYVSYDMANNEVKSTEQFISIKNDPIILDFDSVATTVGGEDYIISTYTSGNDFETGNDREVYLKLYNVNKDKEYYSIRITNDGLNDSAPKLNEFGGRVYLTWLNSGYIFNIMDVTELLEAFTDTEAIGDVYVNADSDDENWYKKTAEDLGISEEEYVDSLYANIVNGNFRTSEGDFRKNSEINSSISDYILASNGEDIYIFFTAYSEKDYGAMSDGEELYGFRYKLNGEGAKGGGFTKAVQITDYNMVLDEVDLYMNEDSDISVVSNYYKQAYENGEIVTGSNSLVELEFVPENSLAVKSENIGLPSEYVAGARNKISFDVINEGLLTTKGYEVKVTQSKNGSETEIYSEVRNDVIDAGEESNVEFYWDVPEDTSDMTINVYLKETGVDSEFELAATKEVPYGAILNIENCDIVWEYGIPYVSGQIRNTGNVASIAGKCNVSAIDDNNENTKSYIDIDVPSLATGEKYEFKVPIEIAFDDFSEYGIIDLKLELTEGTPAYCTYTMISSSKPVCAQINDGAEKISLNTGKTSEISVKAAPWNDVAGDVLYYSDDVSVATVSQDGIVTAQAPGSTVVTAYYPKSGISDTIDVEVSRSSSSSSGGGGGSLSVKATATPSPTEAPSETAEPQTTEVPSAGDTWFTDVPEDMWYYDSVRYVWENGLMNGVSDTEFAPEINITRGMLVTVLGRAENIPGETPAQTVFTDVDENAYYAPYISWAAENGIVEGFEDGTFRPDENVTREQLAKVFLGYYTAKGEGPVGTWAIRLDYTDLESISDWAAEGVMFCTMKGLMTGRDDNTFDPLAGATRAEFAAILMRMADSWQ